ncbi:probable leucine-rich repeat receptor-like protein kinase At5g63930 [Zingiber officinale]|uniref:probable leucine-rich repeat receptor-like protein kinase At5g63930 n=1 Tax=Zingiber officinale TaxID=94328 RepID=UPI001C4C441B|nr:probable leucine-rich repeat receptor-like protein kinase At5g63930 [Zingiber officinale]
MASPADATAPNPFLSLFLIITLLFPSKSMDLCIEKEREVLLSVRAGVPDADKQLPPWSGHDCCSWEGVGCNNITGHVVTLDLSVCPVIGPRAPAKLHSSLFDLKHLHELDLSCNNFYGAPLPELIGSLTMLKYLHLYSTAFSGKIPHQLGNLSNLLSLDLSHNYISEEIPESIGNLKNLQFLYMSNNKIIGAIPGALGSLCNLSRITLSHNRIAGELVDFFELSRCKSRLTYIDLCSNQLNGSVPTSLGKTKLNGLHLENIIFKIFNEDNIILIAKNLTLHFTSLALVTSIDLSNNNLSGPIPRELTNLRGLHFLNLSSNHFSGNIPENIGFMNQLESLDLSKNQLSGRIPSNISALNFLSVLNLSYNNLVGEVPTGSQLRTFTNWSYIGNPKLCGEPLQNKCLGDNSTIDNGVTKEEDRHEDDEYERIWYLIGFALGFVFGFWGFMATVMIKKSTRIKYILLIDRICVCFA